MGEKATCSICGDVTGLKGNKCFVLSDGYMCQTCACKASPSPLENLAPKVFAGQAASEIQLKIARRVEIGDEQWAEELKQGAFVGAAQNRAIGNTAKCPKCGSTSVSADKKGFGVGKAVVGAAVAGPLGLVAGNIGAKKVRITCLNCGHQWMA